MVLLQDITNSLGSLAPLSLAAPWDNVGLLLGDASWPVDKVMTCLTITPAVVAEAVAENANVIVAHHPIMFKGTKTLTSTTTEGRLLLPLLTNRIAVYSAHTAYDDAPEGINAGLCQMLGLENVKSLRPVAPVAPFKVTVFVPKSNLDVVMNAMFAAGAGAIGNYTECGFRIPGTGTFFGNDNANPVIGTKGKREEVEEYRFESIVQSSRLEEVITAMRSAHMYEEPAFDVYPLHPNTLRQDEREGHGRIGQLPQALSLNDFARLVKNQLNANGVQVIGNVNRAVKTVAVACGAAGEYLTDAIRAKADVFLTGELRFHDGLKAEEAGLAVVLPGHYASERPGVEAMAGQIAARFPTLKVWASRAETDPFTVLD